MSVIESIEITVATVDDPGVMDRSPENSTTDGGLPPSGTSDESQNQRSGGESPQVVIVTVRSSDGIEGHGFGWGIKGGMRVAHAIAEVYRPELIGEDPFDREKLWHKAQRADRFGGHAPITAYGPLDVALWDIAGQAAGIPLYKYIGAYRNKIPAYASSPFMTHPSDYAELALQAQSDGFMAFKLHPPGEPELDIECCAAVRDAVGPGMELMSDPVGGAYDHEDAIRVGRALEKLDFLWLEEPLYDHDIHGLEKLTSKLDIPICAGEWKSDFFSKVNYLKNGAADIIRADVSWTGGITGTLKSAHFAEGFGVNCELHMTVLSLMDVANLHVALAIKNCRYFELPYPDGATFGIAQPVAIDSCGYVSPSSAAGLGVELDWDAIDRQTVAII
ncbi:MAG: enolase C-terminal domain-like protein [Dehalococcoidia bacterium]|jgi:L-alanine-DL-glutamate epimerase-like enolase superfamily enzyme|nr:mandelate racemase [Chloroflexota bacterium]MDP6056143.1 enolase C-terminal domain-like protein [Dehalococcoidia bacterium]MDP7485014.1 enolase C-terminal domain-like protein [Dehalococcoidia bacterium]|tara:strand:- start:733 stop:1902 length:1170 start_codon:yes stop_codon:yes gene_type:complete